GDCCSYRRYPSPGSQVHRLVVRAFTSSPSCGRSTIWVIACSPNRHRLSRARHTEAYPGTEHSAPDRSNRREAASNRSLCWRWRGASLPWCTTADDRHLALRSPFCACPHSDSETRVRISIRTRRVSSLCPSGRGYAGPCIRGLRVDRCSSYSCCYRYRGPLCIQHSHPEEPRAACRLTRRCSERRDG